MSHCPLAAAFCPSMKYLYESPKLIETATPAIMPYAINVAAQIPKRVPKITPFNILAKFCIGDKSDLNSPVVTKLRIMLTALGTINPESAPITAPLTAKPAIDIYPLGSLFITGLALA